MWMDLKTFEWEIHFISQKGFPGLTSGTHSLVFICQLRDYFNLTGLFQFDSWGFSDSLVEVYPK